MAIDQIKARLRQYLADTEAEQADAQQRERDMLSRHREELSRIQREIDTAIGKASGLRLSLAQLDALGDAGPGVTTPGATRRRRGRSLSSEWNAWLGHLPVAPAVGMEVGPFIDIVHRDRPDMPRANIRSQLSSLKTKRWVELDGTRWRLMKPLAALAGAASENEDAAEAAPSDAEAPAGSDPAGASDSNSPLLSLATRAAA